jgi:hypothetical protein
VLFSPFCSLECIAVYKPPQQSASIDAPVLGVIPLFGAVAAAVTGPTAGHRRAGAAQSIVTSGSGSSGGGGSSLRQSLRSQEPLLVISRGPAAHIMSSATGAVLCTLTHSRQAAAVATVPSAPAAGEAASSGKPAPVASSGNAARAGPRLVDLVAGAVAPQGKLIYLLTADRTVLAYSSFTGVTAEPSATLEAATHGEPLGLAHHPHRNLLATFSGDGTARLFKP